MNLQHLRAFSWLQWRLRVNQLKKGGALNAVILAILGVGAVLLSVFLFVLFYLLGVYAFDDAVWQPRGGGSPAATVPEILMYVWDGFIVAFLFTWMIGLVTDLQRSEALALDRFLHLPVTLGGVFVLNYVSSLLSLTLVLFVPAMLGFALGLVLGRGPEMLLLLPLLAAFLLMITAVSYQFQGWLASLMVNKRRRRTIVVVVTAVFILIFQLPNLINILRPWEDERGRPDEAALRLKQEQAEAQRAFDAKEITLDEFQKRDRQAVQRFGDELRKRRSVNVQQFKSVALALNVALPPGWLAWGAMKTAEGNGHYALLALGGMALIGAASLRRAYRTTLRLYTGQFTAGKKHPVVVPPSTTSAAAPTSAGETAAQAAKRPARLLEMRLPWVSEHAAAIAVASFRSLLRAPEVKMLLLSPLIMMLIFGGVMLRRDVRPPEPGPWFEFVPPLMATGAMTMVLLTLTQLAGNQFGFDRGGFRVFVLCPARRGDVLLGKNLALAPLALTIALIGVIVVAIAAPMRWEHLLATLPQMISLFLLYCLLVNCLAIMAPLPIAAGTLRARNTRMLPVLLNFALLLAMPIVVAPTLLPLAVEFVLEYAGLSAGVPWCLVLSVLLGACVVFFYRWLVPWQGLWLQAREQRILEIVAAKAE